jgi:hypothetical protein
MVEFDEADEEAAGAATIIDEVYEGRSSMDESTRRLGRDRLITLLPVVFAYGAIALTRET